jgi:amino acid transporter
MKQKSKISFLVNTIVIVFFLLISIQPAQAALVKCGGYNMDGTAQPPCKLADVAISIQYIINFLLSGAWLVAIFFIMWAGWGFVNAAGNQEKISEAKKTFSNAVIGFFLVMAVYLLLNAIIFVLTGVDVKDLLKNYLDIVR